jgi:hypothetical protein
VRNTIADERSQIMLYQKQIHSLRQQLQAVLAQQNTDPSPDIGDMQVSL